MKGVKECHRAWNVAKLKNLGIICGAVLFLTCLAGCKTVYVPVQGETIIEYRDSIITKLDTVTAWKTKIETVRDYTGLLDTLKLSTANAEAMSWIDTTKGILTGSLKDKDTPVEVAVPIKEEYHQKDSVVIQEVPIPVEVEKIKKIYPKWMIILSFLGVILSGLGIFQLYSKFRTKLPL